MFESDSTLQKLLDSGMISIENLDRTYIRPASIDLTVSAVVCESIAGSEEINSDTTYDSIKSAFNEHNIGDKFILKPSSSVICRTKEIITINSDNIGFLVNRNSLVRLGISVSVSIVNPGYSGFLPFILRNESNFNFSFKEGDRLCQLVIAETKPVNEHYGMRDDSKYVNNNSMLSLYNKDKK